MYIYIYIYVCIYIYTHTIYCLGTWTHRVTYRNPKPVRVEARGLDGLARAVIRGEDVCHQERMQILRGRVSGFFGGFLKLWGSGTVNML